MGGGERACDAQSAAVFVIGLVAGTVCIIVSKALFELKAVGSTGKLEEVHPPVFESFVMFFGMLFALPMYLSGECYKRYRAQSDSVARAALEAETKVTFGMLLSLGMPAIFDLSSVLLMMAGLMHIPASMWMLLRGGGIVFVALMKQFVLGDKLSTSMWVGVGTITLAVCLVGLAPTLDAAEPSRRALMQQVMQQDEDMPQPTPTPTPTPALAAEVKVDSGAFTGVVLTILGTLMQSVQYVYEEKVMSGDNPAPPWLLIGMEGLFGSLLCIFVVYPLAGIIPGNNHGVFEDLSNTMTQLENNQDLVTLSAIFCVAVFILNSFSVLVTFMLSSVWHAILDNFRPISIWAVELCLYIYTDGAHGEKWTTGSYLQLAGLGVMLLGTAIYNGNLAVPFLPPSEELLFAGDKRATPALQRSPNLMRAQMGDGSGAHKRSPYVTRIRLAGAEEPLV